MNHVGITVIFIHSPLISGDRKVIGCFIVSWAAGRGCGEANKRSPADCGCMWKVLLNKTRESEVQKSRAPWEGKNEEK